MRYLVTMSCLLSAMLGTASSAALASNLDGATATAEYYFANNVKDGLGGYNGTVTGTAAYVPGPGGRNAFSFDGNTSISTTSTNNLGLVGQSFTVDAWVKFSDLSSDHAVFGTTQGGTDNGLHLQERVGGTPATPAIMMGFYSDDLQPNSPALSTNTWYNVAWVYDASTHTQSIYENGTMVASSSGHNNFNGGNEMALIGKDCCGGNMKGAISNLFVFNSALSQSQIQAASAVVPEPSSLLLAGIGLVGIVAVARRRRRSA